MLYQKAIEKQMSFIIEQPKNKNAKLRLPLSFTDLSIF